MIFSPIFKTSDFFLIVYYLIMITFITMFKVLEDRIVKKPVFISSSSTNYMLSE